jgi:hypothetical protein
MTLLALSCLMLELCLTLSLKSFALINGPSFFGSTEFLPVLLAEKGILKTGDLANDACGDEF